MNNIIGISTGAVYPWADQIDEQISFLRQAGAKAVEILFADAASLDQKISEDNANYLRNLQYVSIHSPFFFEKKSNKIEYKNNDFSKNIIKKVSEIYFSLNAKTTVIHPQQVHEFGVIENTGMNICMENEVKKRNYAMEQLEKLFDKNPQYGMILDTAHALTYDQENLIKLTEKFKERIKQVHFSDRRYSQIDEKVKDHQQLLNCPDMAKFEILKKLNCPIIIELAIKDKKYDIDNITAEIKFVHEFFKK